MWGRGAGQSPLLWLFICRERASMPPMLRPAPLMLPASTAVDMASKAEWGWLMGDLLEPLFTTSGRDRGQSPVCEGCRYPAVDAGDFGSSSRWRLCRWRRWPGPRAGGCWPRRRIISLGGRCYAGDRPRSGRRGCDSGQEAFRRARLTCSRLRWIERGPADCDLKCGSSEREF